MSKPEDMPPTPSPGFPPSDFLNLKETDHPVIFENVEEVWQALEKISPYLQFRLKPAMFGRVIGSPQIGPNVFVGKDTVIEHGAMIKGPAWIGEGCQIRNGCYIRENVILGNGVVAGNSSEFKNCLIFNGAEVPHFNYVGDSILGHKAHLGAGVILSNVRLDRREVTVTTPEGTQVSSGLRKFGAIVGDHAEIGCNSVISPGSIIGRHSLIYPGVSWRGVLPEKRIARLRQQVDVILWRDA